MISTEEVKYAYQSSGKLKKTFLNEDGRIYKEGLLEFSGTLPVREEITFLATNMKVYHNYYYDNEKKLIRYNYSTDSMGKPYNETIDFSYLNERLVSEKVFKNNIPVEERFYFYNEISGLPESLLIKKTNSFDLVFFNFSYLYF